LPRLGERGAGVQVHILFFYKCINLSYLQPRSLELHHILGTISDVLGTGKPTPHFRVHDPLDNQKPPKIAPLSPFVEPQIHTPYVCNQSYLFFRYQQINKQTNGILLGQNHHERILRSHLEKMGTVVEFGSELTEFEQSEDHVTVKIVHHLHGEESMEETQVPWLVGTDGAHSIVRKTLGLSFLGETREDNEMVIGDIKVKAGLDDRKVWGCYLNDLTFELTLFYVVLGEMGFIRRVRRKLLCYVFYSYMSLNRVILLRPSGQDEDVFNLLMAGPGVDRDKVLTSREELVKTFYSITKRTDILFGDLVCISKYRSAGFVIPYMS
jgi:FAD binding domain